MVVAPFGLKAVVLLVTIGYAGLGGAMMNNITIKRLAYALASWARFVLASLKSRKNVVLTLAIGATTGLSLPLLYQLAIEGRSDAAHPNQLVTVYHNNGYIALACFGALAAGYIYCMLQMLAREASPTAAQWLARWSDRAFLLVVGSAIAALGLLNLGMLVG